MMAVRRCLGVMMVVLEMKDFDVNGGDDGGGCGGWRRLVAAVEVEKGVGVKP